IFDDSTKTDKGWKQDYTSSDTPNGGWIFNNTTVNAGGNVDVKGASFTNSTLTVTNGSLSLDNGGAAVLTGTSITANDGSVSVHAKAGNIDLTRGNISAKNDINLTADNGSVIIFGASDSARASISSSEGSIEITGNGGPNVGVAFSYANMSSTNMNIVGRTSSGSFSSNAVFGGVFFAESVGLHLINGSGEGNIAAYAYLKEDKYFPAALVFGRNWSRSAINFDGKFHIKGEGGVAEEAKNKISFRSSAVGLWFGGENTLSFSRDSDLTGSGGSGLSGIFPTGRPVVQNISLTSGANLTMRINDGMNVINGDANDGSVGFNFSGNGNVVFNVSEHAGFSGFNLNYLSNTNLTGSLSVTVDNNGDAIVIPGYNLVTLKNANITGISRGGGTGVRIQPGANGHANNSVVNLNNNIINGTSSAGHGVIVTGNNITLVNGEIKGMVTSRGQGAAVTLTGGNSYNLDGVSVTGTSVDGPGVYVSGCLTVNNGAQVVGEAKGRGNGITVSGNLTTTAGSGATFNGTASSGDGIKVAGDTALTGATLRGQTVSGNGVNISGKLTTDNATEVQGQASGQGTGVTLGASLTGAKVSGVSEQGTGLQLADNAVVTDASLKGSSTSGSGVAVTGNISLDDTTAAGLKATSVSGAGLKLDDNANISIVNITTVTQNKLDADGKQVLDASGNPVTETVTRTEPVAAAVTVTGTSGSGSGVSTTGNVSISGMVLNGSATTAEGTGATLGGNLTIADNISGITVNATGNGTALVVDGATIKADAYVGAGKDFVINASTSDSGGTAIKIQGDNQLGGVILNGKATG
ncbi:hypothetical protein NAE50_005381, partial [Salmonella enterica]|nr:hypothetical protein [Salmonella enterica]ELX2845157.1 hypothetical protein [Salmonella enterica]